MNEPMRAVGYHHAGAPDVLTDIELPVPDPEPRDLLVEVHAVSVNPVDTKVRRGVAPEAGTPKVLGYDAAGVVRAVGSEVTLFRPGDRVYYAGSIARPGSNSQLHLVDERIVGTMPTSLDFAAAAALPLTAITAWELLFDRLSVPRDGGDGQHLLIVGAAGGVGSILTQLARRLTRLQVIGTASRAETADWVRELGAHEVLDHSRPITEELARIGVSAVELIAGLTHTEQHFGQLVEALAPQGRIGVIDDPATLDVNPLKPKAGSLHWEFMFARAVFQTPDMIAQHELLTEVGQLVDAGVLRTTLDGQLGEIDAATLRKAHELIETHRSRGKLVLAGWPG